MEKSEVWIVIAAYNEALGIANVIKSLEKAGYNNVVVVDDGSKDNTYTAASAHTPHTFQHSINRGQGAALKTGIYYALLKGAEYIVTFDADGQHRTEDLNTMLSPVIKGEADITLGSRFLTLNSNVPFIRKIFLKAGAFAIWAFYGIWLTDSHNGFRAMNRKAAEAIELRADRMEHASEFIDQIKRKNLRYEEVPIVIKYTDYSLAHGQSTWNAFRIMYKMILHKFMR